MKKTFLLSFIMISFLFTQTACKKDPIKANDFEIEYSKLPQTAQHFISGNFNNTEVTLVKERYDALSDGTFYKVYLTGFLIDFDKAGNWITAGATETELPWSIFSETPILTSIKEYINVNYPDKNVAGIQQRINTSSKYQVDLVSGTRLYFDASGTFVNSLSKSRSN